MWARFGLGYHLILSLITLRITYYLTILTSETGHVDVPGGPLEAPINPLLAGRPRGSRTPPRRAGPPGPRAGAPGRPFERPTTCSTLAGLAASPTCNGGCALLKIELQGMLGRVGGHLVKSGGKFF